MHGLIICIGPEQYHTSDFRTKNTQVSMFDSGAYLQLYGTFSHINNVIIKCSVTNIIFLNYNISSKNRRVIHVNKSIMGTVTIYVKYASNHHILAVIIANITGYHIKSTHKTKSEISINAFILFLYMLVRTVKTNMNGYFWCWGYITHQSLCFRSSIHMTDCVNIYIV
jgi:hypothetical protein